MTDYSKMSDDEINYSVLAIFEPDIDHMMLSGDASHFYHCGPAGDGYHQIDILDYCNNPADAWPIIVKYGISLFHDYGEWESEACLDLPVGTHGTDELCSVGGIDKNPLRAAMIAFLLLKESGKCSS
ncbi:TPA: phage protein NinX family protein [Serratia odorifera]